MSKIDYKSAGVDIDAGSETVDRIKDNVKSTFTPHVLTSLGSFGSLYDLKSVLKEYENPVMVQSIDFLGGGLHQSCSKCGPDSSIIGRFSNGIEN